MPCNSVKDSFCGSAPNIYRKSRTNTKLIGYGSHSGKHLYKRGKAVPHSMPGAGSAAPLLLRTAEMPSARPEDRRYRPDFAGVCVHQTREYGRTRSSTYLRPFCRYRIICQRLCAASAGTPSAHHPARSRNDSGAESKQA